MSFEQLEARQVLSAATLTAVADTYIRDASETRGTQPFIDVRGFGGGDFVGYVRFDLSELDILTVYNATLSLHKVAGSRNDVITNDRHQVRGLADAPGNTPQDWIEFGPGALNTLTVGAEYTSTGGANIDLSRVFELDPPPVGSADLTEVVSNDVGVATTISGADLVAFLNERVAAGGLATFIITINAGNDRGYGFASKEHSDPTLHPRLELAYTPKDSELPADPDPPPSMPRQMEHLNRGIIAMRSGTSQVYVGWRLLGTEPLDMGFNLYRSAAGAEPVKLNDAPLTQTTDFVDTPATGLNLNVANTYFVRPVIDGVELEPSESYTLPASAPVRQYLAIPLQRPAGGQTPDGVNYVYHANDVSVGDLTGDGQYEFILQWDPSNSKDNAHDGYTGNVYVDAYTLDGTFLWRIDLGINVRAGAHYTQFLVYDFDGDGRAEIVMRTAPGTIDGQGNYVLLPGDDPHADFRNSAGRILTGPEYLTVFDGLTGAALATVPFEPARGAVSSWGDAYGNRVDRFLAGVAYLDGERPSIIMSRGYYGPQGGFSSARNEIVAYDWRDGQLTQRWHFGANIGSARTNPDYVGQGAHSLTIGDVTGNGKDDIVYGAAVITHDGQPLYSTTWGHGDALHMSNMIPDRPGMEVFMPHESPSQYGVHGATLRDAATGELIFGIPATNDVGRGVAFDIDPNHPGYEYWATTNYPGQARMIYNSAGEPIYPTGNISYNFGVWWDADPLRELLDGPNNQPLSITKWRYDLATNNKNQTLLTLSGTLSNNGTKANPALTADLFGDWREEIVVRNANSTELRIYTTTIPADPNPSDPRLASPRLYTLMHDPQYRVAVAWQNVGYNQPPHPSFFLGAGMDAPPAPSIYLVQYVPPLAGDFSGDGVVDATDYTVWRDGLGTTFAPEHYDEWKENFGSGGAAATASAWSAQNAPIAQPTVESVAETSSLDLAAAGVVTEPLMTVSSYTSAQAASPLQRTMRALGASDRLSALSLLLADARPNTRLLCDADAELLVHERMPAGAYHPIDAIFEKLGYRESLQATLPRVRNY